MDIRLAYFWAILFGLPLTNALFGIGSMWKSLNHVARNTSQLFKAIERSTMDNTLSGYTHDLLYLDTDVCNKMHALCLQILGNRRRLYCLRKSLNMLQEHEDSLEIINECVPGPCIVSHEYHQTGACNETYINTQGLQLIDIRLAYCFAMFFGLPYTYEKGVVPAKECLLEPRFASYVYPDADVSIETYTNTQGLQLRLPTFYGVCNKMYTTVQDLQCFPCGPGYTKRDDCVTNQTIAQCELCNEGTYQPHCLSANETGVCWNCKLCDMYIQNCTRYQNAVCGGRNKNTEEETPGVSVTFVLGMTLLSIVLFLLLVIIVMIMCTRDITSTCRKHSYINEIKRDEATDRKILRGDNDQDDSKGRYNRDITTLELAISSQNMERSLKNKEIIVDNVATIDCLSMENDKKKDARASAPDVDYDYSDKGLLNLCIADKSKVTKTEDVSKGKVDKHARESKHIAVISPIRGAEVNKHHSARDNRYGRQQLTRERLQATGDSGNSSTENTYNKETTNNGTTQSLADNQIIPVKEPIGSERKGVAEMDWLKLFRCLIPHLPIDDSSWTFFAIALLQNSRELCGLPENIYNEMNKIKDNNKQKDLAYLDLFTTWHNIMASGASLAHVEEALESFDNKIVMEEFKRIIRNPPTKKICDQNTKLSLMPWVKTEQYPSSQRQIFNFAQHESTNEIAETYGILSHRESGHIVKFTDFREASRRQTFRPYLPGPSRQALQHVEQTTENHCYDTNAHHRVRRQGSKLKNKVSQRKSKLKTKFKLAEKMRNMETENSSLKHDKIELIKIILPLYMVPLSRQHYNTFLEYTVNIIMKHNHVSRATVLSITYEAYTEIVKTENGGRYKLYGGNPKLMLDQEQYDSIVFYVKFGRTRVMKEIGELQDNGDSLFLFITYDGKSVLEQYQTQSRMKKRTNLLDSSESDYCSSSTGRSPSETDSSDVNDMESREGHVGRIPTSSSSSTMRDYPADFVFNDENMLSMQQNNSKSSQSSRKRKQNQNINNNRYYDDNEVKRRCLGVEDEISSECVPAEEKGNQEISVSSHTYNRDNANHDNRVQENCFDMSFEDLMKNIDNELGTTDV